MKKFECFVYLSHERGRAPFYICRTMVDDRRSLRALLRKFCFIHSAAVGCVVCDDIVWHYINGIFYRD